MIQVSQPPWCCANGEAMHSWRASWCIFINDILFIIYLSYIYFICTYVRTYVRGCMWGVCKMLVPESGRNSRSAWGPPFGEFISHMSSFLKKNQGGLIASAFSLKLFLV